MASTQEQPTEQEFLSDLENDPRYEEVYLTPNDEEAIKEAAEYNLLACKNEIQTGKKHEMFKPAFGYRYALKGKYDVNKREEIRIKMDEIKKGEEKTKKLKKELKVLLKG